MSKKEDEDSKEWKYEGSENEWDSFDRRMIRYMRKKLDVIGEKMWLGEVGSVFAMNQGDYVAHCEEVMRAIYCMDPSEARKLKK